jgi:outer membrane protein OmpA-like peptidoglycan-associated protein/tetratricopeptide (TPR) repeat protein
MKEKYQILICLLLTTCIAFGQNSNTKVADKLFDRYEFLAAVTAYQKIVANGKGDPYIYKKIADSYYQMSNTTQAEIWYKKAIATKQDAETYYNYAQTLKASGQYQEANKQLSTFASLSPNDSRAKAFQSNANYIQDILSRPTHFNVSKIDINSDKSDFGGFLQNNTLYFTSARNTSEKIYGWSNEPFLDIYQSTLNGGTLFSEPRLVPGVNSKFHDGPATFSADGNTIYFSSDSFRENSYEKNKEKRLKLGKNNLFKATRAENDSWSLITALPFNNKEASFSNPSVSKDGKTLYFSSDMAGSIGGVDIWKVALNNDGSYGEVVNLGPRINTEGNDSFPFIADDNQTLYYASNGKLGLGGLDIYKVDLSKKEEAVNLGKPINSEKDDFCFTFSTQKELGFMSSNRDGNDDLFQINTIAPATIIVQITHAISGKLLADATVKLLDENKKVMETILTNEQGQVKYTVAYDKTYTLLVSKEKYSDNEFTFTKDNESENRIAIALLPLFVYNGDKIKINPIFFEYNKSDITPEGASELDKLVQIMNNYDDLVIDIKSHTDNRGSDAYNITLSEQRARATVAYLISRGIAKERVSGKGFGESVLQIDCGQNCTEAEHAKNRRSEFVIVK